MPGTDPIHDTVVRDELDDLGLLYHLDVRATARRVLDELDGRQRTAFAVAVAERLARDRSGHRHAAPDWYPGIDAVWRALGGDESAPADVCQMVGAYYLSAWHRDHRHDDPADAVDHTVMAALYACECYLHGCLEFAMWAGWRGFDAATLRAARDGGWPHRRPYEVSACAWELAHPVVQAELGRQLADLEAISDDGGVLRESPAAARRLLDRLRSPAAA
jgi:hypothetical protein